MDTKDEARSADLSGKGLRFPNKNILVFAFFLFLSFIFWYITSLGKELEADIKHPVSFTGIPSRKVLAEKEPSKLNLSLKGPGYSLLRLKWYGKKTPLIVDLSKVTYRRTPGRDGNDYYIISSVLVPRFNAQLKSACKVTSVKPDTIFFSLNPASR